MAKNHLLRENAPITDTGWQEIDDEARERLVPALGARKLIDFAGPLGWDYAATPIGRIEQLSKALVDGATAHRRQVLPLVELRLPFTLSRDEVLNADRGAVDIDFDTLDDAAMRFARAENIAIFEGWAEAGITGVAQATPQDPVPQVTDFNEYPRRVATAVERLLLSGINGPYGLAVGPSDYTSIAETAEHGGYPLFDHLHQILSGPIVWAPGIHGAVVMSIRGEDFLFESGQDVSVGYDRHDGDNLHLYLEQSFSFRIATPEAAVVLAE
jgi:uncharacterized linocin/CFP29 family protein